MRVNCEGVVFVSHCWARCEGVWYAGSVILVYAWRPGWRMNRPCRINASYGVTELSHLVSFEDESPVSALSQCYAASEGWLVYSLVGRCSLQDVCSFSVTVWRVTTIRVWWVRGDFGSTILHASLDWAGGVHQKHQKNKPSA